MKKCIMKIGKKKYELKNCPCCNGEAEIMKHGHGKYGVTSSVRCRTCGLTTSRHIKTSIAVESWNTRYVG